MSGDEAATGPVTARAREVARVDVRAQVALEHFDRTVWREIDDARTDFVAHRVAATAEPPPEQPPPSSHHRAATTDRATT
jgi:hypothetical protein